MNLPLRFNLENSKGRIAQIDDNSQIPKEFKQLHRETEEEAL